MTMKYRLSIPAVVPLMVGALLMQASPAWAQVQSPDQQKCVTSLNKAGAKVSATQGKENAACVKNAGKGTEADATACLTADSKSKVQTASDKVATTFDKSCQTLPDFGPTDAAVVSTAAKDETLGLATDLFGADVTGAMVLATTDSDAAKCQASMIKAAQKLSDLILKDFGSCKSSGFKAGTLDQAAELAACIDTVSADVQGKIAQTSAKIGSTLEKTCEGLDIDTTLPGFCTGYTRQADCIAARARCRACSALAVMDGLGNVCDRFDDNMPGNASCGVPMVIGEHVAIPNSVEPAETPGTPGVVVANSKLLAHLGGGADLNRSDYVRFRLSGPDVAPDAIVILVPGFGAGVNIFRIMAEDILPKILADKGLRLEMWAFSRRDDQLEDREGAILATDKADAAIAQDWYYGAELGLALHPDLVAGPNRRAVFYNSSSDIPFLANFTPQVFSLDLDVVVDAALAVTPNVFLGGHSAGTGFTARYAATDLNTSGAGPTVPAYAKLRGLILLEGGGGSTAASAPLSADSIDRIIAKADGGLFGAVRDNAARCVDGSTPCTIANEAANCVGQVPPKCTLPTTAYTSIAGLQPQIYAAGEVGAIQGITDPESGQLILQVDQGSPGNNAIAQVPGLSVLAPPLIPPATVHGLFGIFLDDDGFGASLSAALATSLGSSGPVVNGLATWRDINDGVTLTSAVPNNGPMPTSLPAGIWGKEVEVTRMDRHSFGFAAGGENSSDWYFAGSGLSTTSVSGLCAAGTCSVGKVGGCATNAECSQSINLDSSALSATRPDIANLTQAGNIDIPVISFGGSNGLTPVGASFLAFGQSIGACTAPSCDGTARVVDTALPNPAFPTYGNVEGGYEVYISEGYAHVDVTTAEDTLENQIPERMADFIERNLVP